MSHHGANDAGVIDKVRLQVRLSDRMKPLTVTEAKPRLGNLVDRALRSEPIFLRRGKRMVQIVPAAIPEPIPVLPEGALTMTEERVAFINSMPAEADPLAQ
jgi:hypothetical protein